MRPAPWSHPEGFKEYLSKFSMPGRFDPETNDLIQNPFGEKQEGEELIEIFDNEEYGGYGLRAKKRLCATESDLFIAAISGKDVLNRRNIELKYGDRPNRYYELFELWDIKPNPGLEIRLILLLQILETHEPEGREKQLYVAGYMDKAFPKNVPVPTMWSQDEMKLLGGTSLHGAVSAKYNALNREFGELRFKTQNLPWAQEAFWKDNKFTIEDWFLIDAWCRSRSMELPVGGTSMVPFIDLVNHSSRSNVQYDVDEISGDVILKLKTGAVIEEGEELYLNYGADKSASEMLFSYGFIEKTTLFEFLIGHIPNSVKMPAIMPNQDEKLECWGRRFGTPMMTISGKKGNLELESPFVYFLMLVGKDGLRLKEITCPDDPNFHDVRALWHDIDITDRLDNMETILKRHPQKELFDIRAMFIYHALINHQMQLMQEAEDFEAQFDLDELPLDKQRIHNAASELRAIESTLIDSAMDIVQDWVSSDKAQEWVEANVDPDR